MEVGDNLYNKADAAVSMENLTFTPDPSTRVIAKTIVEYSSVKNTRLLQP